MNIPVSKVKDKINTLITNQEITLITKNGEPAAALVPYEQYREMYQVWRSSKDEESIQIAKQAFKGKRRLLSEKDVDQLLQKVKDGKRSKI